MKRAFFMPIIALFLGKIFKDQLEKYEDHQITSRYARSEF